MNIYLSNLASRGWERAKSSSKLVTRNLPAITATTAVVISLSLAFLPLASGEPIREDSADVNLTNATDCGTSAIVQDIALGAIGVLHGAMTVGMIGAAAHLDRENLQRIIPQEYENTLLVEGPKPLEENSSSREEDRIISSSKQEIESPPKFFNIRNPGNKSGMFATFLYMLGAYDEFEKSPEKYSGLEVDFGSSGVYYDSSRGENWWEYFFEPICLGEQTGRTREHNKLERWNLANAIESNYTATGQGMPRELGHYYFKKYFRIQPEILNQVNTFTEKHFEGKEVVSVHYRGTDKVCNSENCEAVRVSYEDMLKHVKVQLEGKDLEKTVIFIASDEEPFVQFMEQKFPGKVVSTNVQRSVDGKPLHLGSKNPYKTGEEALIDCLLLARGDVLIRTSSNLSLFVKYINPDMKIIEASQRTVMKQLIKKMVQSMKEAGIEAAISIGV